LGLGDDADGYVILYDQRTGLDYLRQVADLRQNGLELSLDGYGCHVFLGFEEVSDADGAGWAELAQRTGLRGIRDAHLALRRMRDEPLREAVAGIFATRMAEEAFLPESGGSTDTQSGADAARASLAIAVDRLAVAGGATDDTVSIAHDLSRLTSQVRGIRPHVLGQAVAGWVIFSTVGEVACESDVDRTVTAFDEWDGAEAVGDLARRSGSGDAQAWRAVELARALLATEPGALGLAAQKDGLPLGWFESGAIRAASGWNEWEGTTYLGQDAWDEFIDALSERDHMLDVADVAGPAAELKRRAAAAAYVLTAPGGGDKAAADA
jgi:hypothetical protein